MGNCLDIVCKAKQKVQSSSRPLL